MELILNCPIDNVEMSLAATLEKIKLFKCPSCHWLSGFPNKELKGKDPSPDKDKREQYLAIVQKATQCVDLMEGDKVLDINCGDGTLLGWYKKSLVTFGIDPSAENIKTALNEKRADMAVIKEFSAANVNSIVDPLGVNAGMKLRFKIITAIDCLQYQMEIVPFLTSCRDLLHEEGVLLIQAPYLVEAFKTDDFPLQRNYFLTFTLFNALQGVRLRLQGVEFSKDGLLRAYITRPSYQRFAVADYQQKLWLYTNASLKMINEVRSKFDSLEPYKRLGRQISEDTRNRFSEDVENEKRAF